MGPVIGVVLAGGRSRRMGSDKAAYAVAGRPMSQWVAEALTPVCERVVVAGRREPVAGLQPIEDPDDTARGPLAGLVSALRRFPDTPVALVAVDQPWVRGETIRQLGILLDELAVVPVDAGVRQTTCAVYPPGVRPLAEEELKAEGSLQSLLDVAAFLPVTDWHAWGEDGRSWFSVDTPEDADEGLARFGIPFSRG